MENKPLIVIVSNRGPVQFEFDSAGELQHRRGSGGLVTALAALASKHDVLWVAAAMTEGDRAFVEETGGEVRTIQDIDLKLIVPDPVQYERYYAEIANPLLWFIQHQLWDIPRTPSISEATWTAWNDGYVAINRQFAAAVAEAVRGSERPLIILPQDYHLYLMPRFLREELGDRVQIQPFLHIPWPGPDAWRILPGVMREELLRSMLAADRIGFQTRKDAFNFVQTCRFYLGDAHSRGSRDTIYYQGREIQAATYPISVDIEKVQELAADQETDLLKSQLLSLIGDRSLILRVDRVEPSKNILRGLEAYEALLEKYPEHLGKVKMLALLVPSRMQVPTYEEYFRDIMAKAGLINARFSDALWEPVRIIVGDNYKRALAAMQLYDVLLVNPLADGMNLVAKEGVLVNQRDGVLLLSEHAGVFYELGEHSTNLSPYDVFGTAEAIHAALVGSRDARRAKMEALRETVLRNDVRSWFANQVADALSAIASRERKDSTPATPETIMSEVARTTSGVS